MNQIKGNKVHHGLLQLENRLFNCGLQIEIGENLCSHIAIYYCLRVQDISTVYIEELDMIILR